MKGQLSAEMLILIVVILAIVAMVASNLTKTTEKTAGSLGNQTDIITKRSEDAVKGKPGDFCTLPEQCLSNDCDQDWKCR